MAQGEGLTDTERSHFIEFLQTVDSLEAGQIPVKAVAKSPTLGGGHGPEDGEEITHPYTRLWGEVFRLQYSCLVVSIQHALLTRRVEDGVPGFREDLTAFAIRSLRRVISPVSDLIAKLPLRNGSADLAGPPYDLDPSLLMSHDEAILASVQLKMLDSLEIFYKRIVDSFDATTDPDHESMIKNLRNLDKGRRVLLTPNTPPPA